MFRLNRNERSHWSGNGVHVESELVFMIGRNMQKALWVSDGHLMGNKVIGFESLEELNIFGEYGAAVLSWKPAPPESRTDTARIDS